MPELVKFTIEGRPQRWKRPEQAIGKGGRVIRYTDPDVRAYTEKVAWIAKKAMAGRRPWSGPVIVSMVAVFAIPPSWPVGVRRAASEGRVMHIADPDIDQLAKAILDSVRGVVYLDDNQVCGFAQPFAKRYGAPERIDVAFQLLEQQGDEITPGQRRLEAQQAQGALFGTRR